MFWRFLQTNKQTCLHTMFVYLHLHKKTLVMSKNLSVQSNQITLSKINFSSIYEKRIFYAVIDSISPLLKTQIDSKKKGIEIKYETIAKDIDKITYRAKDLEPNPSNYKRLKETLKKLSDTHLTIENKDYWVASALLLTVDWEKNNHHIEILVHRKLYKMLFDIDRGYTLLDVKAAIDLNSMYAMKIYELLAKHRTKNTFDLTIPQLRYYTDTENIYPQTSSLKKRVLDIAKKNLEESDLTDLIFTYKDIIKKGRVISGFKIFIHKTNNSYEKAQEIEYTELQEIPQNIIDTLDKLGVKIRGKNIDTYKTFSAKINNNEVLMMKHITHWIEASNKDGLKNNFSGYLMSCFKGDPINFKNKKPDKKQNFKLLKQELKRLSFEPSIFTTKPIKKLIEVYKNNEYEVIKLLQLLEYNAKDYGIESVIGIHKFIQKGISEELNKFDKTI